MTLKGKTTSTYVRIDALLDNVSVVANGKGGGYLPQAFTFSADGKSTTLTFKDVSTVTQNVDLLLDNVVLTDADPRASRRKFGCTDSAEERCISGVVRMSSLPPAQDRRLLLN